MTDYVVEWPLVALLLMEGFYNYVSCRRIFECEPGRKTEILSVWWSSMWAATLSQNSCLLFCGVALQSQGTSMHPLRSDLIFEMTMKPMIKLNCYRIFCFTFFCNAEFANNTPLSNLHLTCRKISNRWNAKS